MIVESKATRADIAYHESAHAVACIVADSPFEVVDIIPNESRGRLGGVTHNLITIDDFKAMPRGRQIGYLFVYLAGPESDKYRNGEYDTIGCQGDWRIHSELMQLIPPEERYDVGTEVKERAVNFAREHIQQARIEKLAKAGYGMQMH